MGLCKCPKRKVTNQFCFEHRVNVCEHCMVNKHPKCVVQSYLQWLQDSDYNPNCEFCQQDLSEEACVRLACFHVFHWVCLDKHARSLPATTAPAGYQCPTCSECIFPAENSSGPVIDALRVTLKDVNWARAGLGLPLLEDRVERIPEFSVPSGPRPTPEGKNDPSNGSHVSHAGSPSESHSTAQRTDQIINFDTPTSRVSSAAYQKDKIINNEALLTSPLLRDPDENKYQRKSGLELLLRWTKTFLGPSSRRRGSKMQRYCMTGLLLFLAFLTLIVIMSYLGRGGGDDDPMLEPRNNPNIRVAE